MTYVFTLNMTYDVPVKLLSFQLALLSVVILTPSLRRVADFFLLNRAIAPQNPGTSVSIPAVPIAWRRPLRSSLPCGSWEQIWMFPANTGR